jgi:phospholipase C
MSEPSPPTENSDGWHQPDHLQYAEAELASQLPIEGDYHTSEHRYFDSEEEAKHYTRYRYHYYYDYYGQR